MKKIAFYGKGGIGKSTTVSNLSAALAEKGYTVMQIGCDPKADSTINLHGDTEKATVLDLIRARNKDVRLEEMVTPGYNGVLCVEAGGPTPGLGCAGRGIVIAMEALDDRKAYDIYKPDFVFYDVLGDVVCGGFSMPLREGYADKVFILTSGEAMAIHASMNIAVAVETFERRGTQRWAASSSITGISKTRTKKLHSSARTPTPKWSGNCSSPTRSRTPTSCTRPCWRPSRTPAPPTCTGVSRTPS